MKSVIFTLLCILFYLAESCNLPQNKQGVKNTSELGFTLAKPIWAKGREQEKNLSLRFSTEFELTDIEKSILKIAGASLYRIFINGEFVGHGPARAAHGYYRVDEIDLTNQLTEGTNTLTIEVAGYNVNSYYLLDQPSFLQAELAVGDNVVAATKADGNDFLVKQMTERIQKVPRYSFQRPFTEVYHLGDSHPSAEVLPCEEMKAKQLISRRIEYADFEIRTPEKLFASGKVKTGQKPERYWKDRAVVNISEKLKGFHEKELNINPAIELQEIENVSKKILNEDYKGSIPLNFPENSFSIIDFGLNTTGFIGAEINCKKASKIYFTFDEILSQNDVDFKRLGCINSVTYSLEPGKYAVESFEPYTLRYLKIIAVEGECEIDNAYIREYVNSDISGADFYCSNVQLNRIYAAGVETFRQNAVDIFMDCPSRERAGWLCDSYFTSRVAADLSGNTKVEKNFFENFLLPDSFQFIPDGMLPMCYPADHNDSVFIPNWAMWFVVQLEEYLYRSGDRKMVDALKPRVLKLLDYFETYKNADGLLEGLDSWVFVEWSRANSFVQDVNYPTNMLYSATLEAASDLYHLPELKQEATKLREVIREQSFNGEFFVDNALRKENGEFEITSNTSEVCQYYAFYFDIATPEKYPGLWEKLLEQFGPKRKEENPYPDVYFANAFVGNYLRLELLSRYHENAKILSESIGFFDYMAERTGTLWENISTSASCNHGFASHVVHLFYRDVLGISDINRAEKKVILQFSDVGIKSCKGQIPVGAEMVRMEWEKKGEDIFYRLELPKGYKSEIRNLTACKLVEN